MKHRIQEINFNASNKIALIVRGKNREQHKPNVLNQHADVILSDGSPRGFFGEGAGKSGSGASSGWRMDGKVFDYNLFKRRRPAYVNLSVAEKYNVKSTLLVLTVTASQAKKFSLFWQKLKEEPGKFSLLGDNCSTHAGEAFKAAGIVNRGIPGLDTPDNLYNFLRKNRSKSVTYSGFLGINPSNTGSAKFKVEVKI